MPDCLRPSPEDDHRGRWPRNVRLVLWAVFLAVGLLFGRVKVSQNEAFWAAQRAHRRRQQQLQRLGLRAGERVIALLRARPTRRQLEQQLNDGAPFVLSQGDGRRVTTWTDPASGRRFEIRFRDGVCTGYRTGWGTDDVLRQVPPVSRAAFENSLERVRRMVPRYAGACWCLLLLLCVVLRRYRRLIAELLLAAALLCNLAWLVAPGYSLTFRGITSNDMLFIGVLMLAASLCTLALTQPGPLRLQFGLGTLLAVTTLCGVLLAMGSLGYVLLGTAGVGWGFYLLVRLGAQAGRMGRGGLQVAAADDLPEAPAHGHSPRDPYPL